MQTPLLAGNTEKTGDTSLTDQNTKWKKSQFSVSTANRTSNKTFELQGRYLCNRRLTTKYLRTKIGCLVRLWNLHHWGHFKSRLNKKVTKVSSLLSALARTWINEIKPRMEWNLKSSTDNRFWNIIFNSALVSDLGRLFKKCRRNQRITQELARKLKIIESLISSTMKKEGEAYIILPQKTSTFTRIHY